MPFQTHFDFRHPTRIVHGPGSIACLADCFSPTDKVLIVSDQVLGEIGTVEAVTTALGDIPHAVYLKDGSSEPTQESVEDGVSGLSTRTLHRHHRPRRWLAHGRGQDDRCTRIQ